MKTLLSFLCVLLMIREYSAAKFCTTSKDCSSQECCVQPDRAADYRECQELGKPGGYCVLNNTPNKDGVYSGTCPCEPATICRHPCKYCFLPKL
uniref:U26-Liphistoxin-Lm1a_1 n=1 Tax=Liphistius malayanus TaxID=1203467 RepID=A0A482Z8I2_9ARAC